jgi:hypothetical protein
VVKPGSSAAILDRTGNAIPNHVQGSQRPIKVTQGHRPKVNLAGDPALRTFKAHASLLDKVLGTTDTFALKD